MPFKLNEDSKSKILKVFNKNLKDLKEDTQRIKEWLKTQPHFPEIPSDKIIEYFLVTTKFSLENTKQKLEWFYLSKPIILEQLGQLNPKLEWFKESRKTEWIVALPELRDELYRIVIYKLKNSPAEKWSPHKSLATLLNLYVVRIHEDLMCGDVLIFDYENYSFNHMKKVTPSLYKLLCTIAEKVCSNRIKEIHFINHPSLIDGVLKILKMFLKPKVYERIKLHDSIESLKKYVPEHLLPKDYGGQGMSLDELQDLWIQKFDEFVPRFDELENFTMDLSLRPTPLKCDEIFGLQGSFKQLTVD